MGCKSSKARKNQEKKVVIKSSNQGPHKFKIVLLGSSNVGKTSIATNYCLSTTSKHYGPTIGGVYFKKQFKLQCGTPITVNIWDTAGEEKYRSMASLYYRDADVVLLVFDLSNYSTFKDLEYWVSELDYRLQKQDLMVIVVGNKVDRNPRAVQKKAIEAWISGFNDFKYVQISATTGLGVGQIFQLAGESFLGKTNNKFIQ